MKARIKCSGSTVREEMIIDGQNLLKEELEHDSSYSPTLFFWNCNNGGYDDKLANLRIYGRKHSSSNGYYQHFITTHDNPVKIGDYFHDTKDNTYWLVYNSFNVDDIHYEGKMILCNYLLKWQLSDGTIVERWANTISTSNSDRGETGNNVLITSSNSYSILIGYCEEGLELDEKRVFIDNRITSPTKVYKITGSDNVSNYSGNMGALLSFTAEKREFNPHTDNQKLRICDYIEPSSPTPPTPYPSNTATNIKAVISGNTHLRNSYKRTFTVKFTDENDNDVDWNHVDFKWHVIADFDVIQKTNGNKITLSVNDEKTIEKTFLLCLAVNNIIKIFCNFFTRKVILYSFKRFVIQITNCI